MITDFIPVGHDNAVSRQYLVSVTGMKDREIRDAIHDARRDTVIINIGNGYYRPDPSDEQDMHDLKAFEKQETHRLKSIGWALKSARKMIRESKT